MKTWRTLLKNIIDKNRLISIALVIVSIGFLFFSCNNKSIQPAVTIETNSISGFMPVSDYFQRMESKRIQYSPRYDFRRPNRPAFSNDEWSEFRYMCYRCEAELYYPPGSLVSLGIIETSLQPHRRGMIDEVGVMQIMSYNWAYIQYLYDVVYKTRLPKWLNPNLRCKEDLQDPVIQVKAASIILYHYGNIFDWDWRWMVTAYHFGETVALKWYAMDYIPLEVSFMYSSDGRVQSHLTEKYWFEFENLRMCFQYDQTGNGWNEIHNDIVQSARERKAYEQAECAYLQLHKWIDERDRQVANAEARCNEAVQETQELRERIESARPILDEYAKVMRRLHYQIGDNPPDDIQDTVDRLNEQYNLLLDVINE